MAQPKQTITPEVQQLLSQLRDISGLKDVSWWPLAPGWWFLLVLVLAIPTCVFLFKKWRRMRARRLEEQIKAMLADLRGEASVKKKAQGLSELLRLAALRRYGRASCAGLEGKRWLVWLKDHDPANFDWPHKAGILIKAPYMPDQMASEGDHDFDDIFRAVERWIRQ